MYTKKIKFDEAEAKRIRELSDLFTDEKTGWLDIPRAKKIPESIRKEVDDRFRKYARLLELKEWHSGFAVVLKEMKGWPRQREADRLYAKAYMVRWMVDFPDTLTADWLFRSLTSREAALDIISKLYEKKDDPAAKILIHLEGGLVQDVFSNAKAEYRVADLDLSDVLDEDENECEIADSADAFECTLTDKFSEIEIVTTIPPLQSKLKEAGW